MLWRIPLLGTGLLGAGIFLGLERYFIYIPERRLDVTPQSEGLAYEDIRFAASDGTMLHGWLIPAPGAKVTLLWCHGNAGNISHRVDNAKYLHRLLKINVFIFDYRGYGASAGSMGDLSEESTYSDAEGALAFLRGRPELASTRLVYFGRSLGAAIAVELAKRHPPAGLILETPFTSIPDMAHVILPIVPLSGWLRNRYDSLSKIGALRVPLLVLHGDRDDVIPYEQGRRLFEAANPPKTFYTIRGARHNDTYIVGGDDYFRAWAEFFRTLGDEGVIPRQADPGKGDGAPR
jgi:fermentation-respiration switch protein FrsA (DUF1100 family)